MMQVSHRFALGAEDCELLLVFEQARTLAKAAQILKKDTSVISRRLAGIARSAPVLEKRNGRWELTSAGVDLNRWTLDAISGQRRVLVRQQSVRVGSTREFAARVLVPGFSELFPSDDEVVVTIRTYEDGIEAPLLSGEIDFGFDCGRPRDPLITFATGAREPFSVCASPSFVRKHRVRRFADLAPLPHVLYSRASASPLGPPTDARSVRVVFNDLACAREAALAGLGWAILPTYCVRIELDSRRLVAILGQAIPEERFGVWALREHHAVKPWLARASTWLKSRRLG